VVIERAEFIKSVVDPAAAKLPFLPEIALVGRSNVGKSSLINTLTGRNKLAKVGSTPGKTRQVNYFLLNESFYLVDLPGYGYAKVSHEEKAGWEKMIEGYLTYSVEEKRLRHLFLLLDIRHEPKDSDLQMAYWAEHYAVPCTIIATKADKINRSQRGIAAGKLSNALRMTFPVPVIPFSSLDGEGRKLLLTRLGEINI